MSRRRSPRPGHQPPDPRRPGRRRRRPGSRVLRRAVRAHPVHGCADREAHLQWGRRWQRLVNENAGVGREGRRGARARWARRSTGSWRCSPSGAISSPTGSPPAGRVLSRIWSESDLVVAECLRTDAWAELSAARPGGNGLRAGVRGPPRPRYGACPRRFRVRRHRQDPADLVRPVGGRTGQRPAVDAGSGHRVRRGSRRLGSWQQSGRDARPLPLRPAPNCPPATSSGGAARSSTCWTRCAGWPADRWPRPPRRRSGCSVAAWWPWGPPDPGALFCRWVAVGRPGCSRWENQPGVGCI